MKDLEVIEGFEVATGELEVIRRNEGRLRKLIVADSLREIRGSEE